MCNRNSKSWRRGGAKWRDRCGPDGRHDATNPTLQLAASRSGCCAATADNSRAGLEGWRALQLSRLRQPAVRLGSTVPFDCGDTSTWSLSGRVRGRRGALAAAPHSELKLLLAAA